MAIGSRCWKPGAVGALLWGLLAAGPVGAQSQPARISVRVLHLATPLSGATVRSGPVGAITGPEGLALLDLSPGLREIIVERLGFRSDTLQVTLPSEGDTTLVVSLQEAPLEMEAIVVSATRSGTVVKDQPIRVEAVPMEEIEENQTIAPGNLLTLLNELSGVQVEAAAPGLGGGGFRIQGMSRRHTQLLVDGLPQLGSVPDGFSLLQTPPLDLARVEVIKGVASALYGGSALGGVINLVSKKPVGDPQLLVNQTSRGGTDLVGFLPGQLTPEWGYTVTAGAHGQSKEDPDRDGWAELAGYRRALVRPRLYWDGGPGRSVLATMGVMAEDRTGGTLRGRLLSDGMPYRERLETRRFDGGAEGRYRLDSEKLVSSRVSLTHQRHRRTFEEDELEDQETTLFLEATLQGNGRGHTWIIGSAFEREAFSVPFLQALDFTYSTPALFGQDEFRLGDRLSVTGSARLDFQTDFGTFFSPRLSALLRPFGDLTLRAAVGTGFSLPRPLTEEVEAVGFSRLIPPEGLKAERATSASLDAEWTGGPWEVNMSLFTSRIGHPFDTRRVEALTPARLEIYTMEGPRRTRGMEALLHYSHGILYVLGSYTYLNATEADPQGGRRAAERVPHHMGEIGAIAEEEGVGRLGVEIAYTGRMRVDDDPYRAFSRPFLELNVLAAKNLFGETQIFLNAINLLNVRQSRYDPLLLPSPSPVGRRTTDIWAPLAGRVVNLGVSIEF